jgi:hypothetical protein
MGLLPAGNPAPMLSLEYPKYIGRLAKDVGRDV